MAKYTTKAEVIALMKSSKNDKEWNDNCDLVKKNNGGYPEFWYQEIIVSGLINDVLGSGSDEIKMQVLLTAEDIKSNGRQIENTGENPQSFPDLGDNEKVMCIYNQGLGDKFFECDNLAVMKYGWQKYMEGMILACDFYIIDTAL